MKKRKKYQPGIHRDAFVQTLSTLVEGWAIRELSDAPTIRERLELETLRIKAIQFLADEFGEAGPLSVRRRSR